MILTICFFVFCTIHTLYWIVLFARLKLKTNTSNFDPDQLTSVVVVFKNELDNLKVLVPKLLEQDHPNYEIILCDDFSQDGSLKYIESIDNPLVSVLKAVKDLPGKKSALKEAVAFAKGENILVTDADCYPAGNNWITSMSSKRKDNMIVLGYSPHLKVAGWLNKFVRFETYMTALQYFTYAMAGIPYMGVGRNLLYQRSLFLGSDALNNSPQLLSGDDDIFVNEVANGDNTTINLDPRSFVHTYPPNTFSDFIKQKRRHVSTASVYKLYHQLLLALYAFSHLMTYLLFIVVLIYGINKVMLVCFLVTLFIRWLIANKTMKVLQCEDLSLYFPILDFLIVLYYVFLTPATFFKTKNW